MCVSWAVAANGRVVFSPGEGGHRGSAANQPARGKTSSREASAGKDDPTAGPHRESVVPPYQTPGSFPRVKCRQGYTLFAFLRMEPKPAFLARLADPSLDAVPFMLGQRPHAPQVGDGARQTGRRTPSSCWAPPGIPNGLPFDEFRARPDWPLRTHDVDEPYPAPTFSPSQPPQFFFPRRTSAGWSWRDPCIVMAPWRESSSPLR